MRQKEIFNPVLKSLKTYLKFTNQMNKDCDEDLFIRCAIDNGDCYLNAMGGECSTKSKCGIAWNELSSED